MKSIKKNVLVILMALITVVAWAQTGTTTTKIKTVQKPLPKNQVVLMVDSELGNCDATVSQKCMLVKPTTKKEYELFYDPIEGFNYESGFRYNIVVRIDSLKNVPAGSPNVKYTLIKVLSKTQVKKALNADLKILQVNEQTTTCEDSTVQQKCLLVKEPSKKFFEILNEPIEGFIHEAGNSYTIQVRVTSIPGSAGKPMTYQYKLVKILSQTKNGSPAGVTPSTTSPTDKANTPLFISVLDSTGLSTHIWTVQLFRVDTIAYDAKDLKMTLLIHTDQGRVSGKSACNNYFAGLSYDKTMFKLQSIGSTKMYCNNHLMEEKYWAALQLCDNYVISNGALYLKQGDKALVELK